MDLVPAYNNKLLGVDLFVCGFECVKKKRKKEKLTVVRLTAHQISWSLAAKPNAIMKNKERPQNQSPPSAQSLWLPLSNTNNHFPPFPFFSLVWNITLPLIGLFKLLAHHLGGDGWRWRQGEGEREPPAESARDARCGDEAWTPCHITRKMASNKHSQRPHLSHAVCLAYLHAFT